MPARDQIRDLIASQPFAMEAYWLFAPERKRWRDHYKLETLRRILPQAVQEMPTQPDSGGKRVFIFATLHYWIEQAAVIALALTALGHEVELAWLPYSDWRKPLSRFRYARRRLYTRDALAAGGAFFTHRNLDDLPPADLPAELDAQVRQVAVYDVQYTEQVEEIDENSPLFQLRLERNRRAAARALTWLGRGEPDVVLIPNGTILEMGAVYRAARYLGTPAVTYEFNDQREQIWLAQDDEVMRQNTDALWAARGGVPLTAEEQRAIEELENARQGAKPFGKSDRRWQDVPREGANALREKLGLDDRPLALLATNVLGDSLTLGRNLFSRSMAEWISRTVRWFAARDDLQLIVRVHPGERLTHGPSMVDVVRAAVDELPSHIHLIGPLDKVNTYDLMPLASLGLVFTTTTGLEMAMRGIPVIAAGQTHYRGRGFTLDPSTWDEYFAQLEAALADPQGHRLRDEQVELAWRYAYRFFFEYPRPFPWRLLGFGKEYQRWPLPRVLGAEGRALFGQTFAELVGEPIQWTPRQIA